MSLFANFREKLFERSLQRALGGRRADSPPVPTHPSTAKTLSIIFAADDASERKWVEKLKTERSKQGMKTQLLGFFSAKVEKDASYNFPFYSPSDLNWYGVPKGKEIEHFLQDACDLLYVLGGVDLPHFHYLGQLKKAGLKVGPHTFESDPDNFYHVQYMTNQPRQIKENLDRINRLFNIINAKTTATV